MSQFEKVVHLYLICIGCTSSICVGCTSLTMQQRYRKFLESRAFAVSFVLFFTSHCWGSLTCQTLSRLKHAPFRKWRYAPTQEKRTDGKAKRGQQLRLADPAGAGVAAHSALSALLLSSLLLSSLELSDTKTYEPKVQALLGNASQFLRGGRS